MTKFIAFVSGKGGVGKTTSTINVGQALVNNGKNVVLLDANLVTPNLGIHLGFMEVKGTVNQFLRKEKDLREVTYQHDAGISFIPASTSLHEFQKTNAMDLTKVFEHLDDTTDFVLVDAAAGLGYDVTHVLKHCDEVVVVVNPTLSSVMDALKTIQVAESNDSIVAGVILNMTHKGKDELNQKQVEEILNEHIIANVRVHKKVRRAAFRQAPLNHIYPRSRPAKEFRKVAEHLSLQ
jgi:septum site-determining protein MinD